MRQICRTAGLGFFGKFAVEISLISVAVAGTGFITEAMLAVEYIQATRLALIQAHPVVSFVLVSMSLVKCKFTEVDSILKFQFFYNFYSVFLLWIKWLFWLRRWKEVLHVYIHDLQLNTVPNAIILYNSLALILGIILHDVVQKMIKLFYFSRFKPSSLQFTTFQLLSPILDSLLVIVSFAGLIRQLFTRLSSDQEFSKAKLWKNLKMSAFVVGAVPFLIPDDDFETIENDKNEEKLTKKKLRISESKSFRSQTRADFG